MKNRLFDLIKEKYPLSKLEVGEYSQLKVSGMKFSIKAYSVRGLGHVSLMEAKGFLGLMKLEMLMVVPKEKDLPLYSYDRIYAMGNDILIIDLYDTLLGDFDTSLLDSVKSEYAHIPERDPGEHWYDSIKLPQSVSKKAKKHLTGEIDQMTLDHINAYLNSPAEDVIDIEKKLERSAAYVDGLLENGGPSTDVFKKALGKNKTSVLFKNVLFGTGLKNN